MSCQFQFIRAIILLIILELYFLLLIGLTERTRYDQDKTKNDNFIRTNVALCVNNERDNDGSEMIQKQCFRGKQLLQLELFSEMYQLFQRENITSKKARTLIWITNNNIFLLFQGLLNVLENKCFHFYCRYWNVSCKEPHLRTRLN